MGKTLLIAAETRDLGQKIGQMISDFRIKVIEPKAGMIIFDSDLLSNLAVIIVCGDSSLLDTVASCQTVPDHVPIVLLSSSPPPPMMDETSAAVRLIDWLEFPTSPAALQARVLFLSKVAKLGLERNQQLLAHSSFVDIIAKRDGLTGLYNRYHLNKKLTEEFQRAQEGGGNLSLLIVDIDYFHQINRSVGHSFGDFVLNEMSARLTKTTRDNDICFRFSGENFAILMPNTDVATAANMAEQLRLTCSSSSFRRAGTKRNITISVGVASFCDHQPKSQDEFITMAENALYKAKADGRNRVHTYTPLEVSEGFSSTKNLESLKISVNRILTKTQASAMASLQLLTRDIGGDDSREHIEKLTNCIQLIGERMGLPDSIIRIFENSTILLTCIRFLLHSDIISRQDEFTTRERKMLQDLPFKTAEITKLFDFFAMERNILLTHGERYDGSGFPDGMQGSEIPLGTRIFNLVDSFTAMTSDRPHRQKLPPQAVIQELLKEAGKQFDPALILLFFDIIQHHKLLELDDLILDEARCELRKLFPELGQ